ncbi:2-methylpropanoate--CoA ligase ccl4 [Castilleja foliolosa]|uniref:2-methylpropanoate--CoA ligase ccl4 n=1 Tax=Castilleja foliolosa TaxID=1961234 RepID=A0ABD3DCQ0_9LAMI
MYSLKQTPSLSFLLSSYPSFHDKPAILQWLPINSSSSSRNVSTLASSLSLPLSNISNNNSVRVQETDQSELKMQTPNSCPLTPLDFLDRAAVVYGDCPSIMYNEMCRTWSETQARCLKLASSIVSLGIRKGDVVSVLAPNIPAMCELHFAVPMAGAILNTVNLRLDTKAISNLLQHSESKLMFVDCQSAALAREAVSMLPRTSQRPLLVLIQDEYCDNDSFDEKDYDHHHDLDYESMVESGDPGFEWIRPDSEWEPISLNYTSGTTSSPKGVTHSHRGAFMISLDSLLDWSVPKQPVYLWTLPMFHANGWSYAWNLAAVGGVHVCLRRVDTASIYEAIEKYGVTHMCGAPVVLNMLTNHPDCKPLQNPIHIMTAGAPPPAAVLDRAESLGFIVSHGYGLTETGGLVVTCAWKREWNNLPRAERAKMKSRQGVKSIAFAGFDVVDPESGASVPRDGKTMGEIVLRGGSLMLGYLKDPEGTAKSMKNGWFYTGDVGVVHRDGYLELKDRSKDVIITGGENLSSVEVEAVLYSHEAVNEAAVVARPSRFWGETPCAFVTLKGSVAERPTEKDIRDYCKERLPLYMVPRTVVFKNELPKTSTGKLQKFLLRDMAKELGNF